MTSLLLDFNLKRLNPRIYRELVMTALHNLDHQLLKTTAAGKVSNR